MHFENSKKIQLLDGLVSLNCFTLHPPRSTLTTITEEEKRLILFGIALNHVLVPSIRPALEQKILAEYNNLKSNNGIDVQLAHSFPSPKYPGKKSMKYENINANDTKLKPHHKKYDYSTFDYRVTSSVDFAKLFLPMYMAKFTAFDNTCDASVVLNLLKEIPIFSPTLQNAANVVKEGRNAWAHCNFTEWKKAHFEKKIGDMKNLVQKFSLPAADEKKFLEDLAVWECIGIDFVYLLLFYIANDRKFAIMLLALQTINCMLPLKISICTFT